MEHAIGEERLEGRVRECGCLWVGGWCGVYVWVCVGGLGREGSPTQYTMGGTMGEENIHIGWDSTPLFSEFSAVPGKIESAPEGGLPGRAIYEDVMRG